MTEAMSRRIRSPGDMVEGQGKPTLEAVLDHYGVQFVPYKTSQMVRCPVHGDEKTPSCSVNMTRQLWNCHSCGAAGDSWELIKLMEGVDFDRAREFAASQRFPTGDAGGSGGDVQQGYGRRRSSVPPGSRDRKGDGGYVPSWRRK